MAFTSIWTGNVYPGFLTIGANQIERPQVLEVKLQAATPNEPNLMCVYTGTTFAPSLKGAVDGQINRARFWLPIPTQNRKWTSDSNRGAGWTLLNKGAAVAAPASFYNGKVANNALWAVDSAWVEIEPKHPEGFYDEYLQLSGLVAVRDSDGFLHRITYQATVLGRVL
jgi:hypothetical protein